MKDSEYLEQLFIEYLSTMQALNEISTSFYSKDEFKLRHKAFKQIYSKYRAYKIKLFISRIKEKLSTFKYNLMIKRKNKIVRQYNDLKEKGDFLPK